MGVPRAPPSGTVVCWEFLLFCVKRLKNEKKNRFGFQIFRFSGSAITYYKCLRGFFSRVISVSRRSRRDKRVPRAPPFGTVVCWEFLPFCVNPLKNEKKNRFVFEIFRFSGSAITYYKCLRCFFSKSYFGVT